MSTSFLMAPDGQVCPANERQVALGDVRYTVQDGVVSYTPPASRLQQQTLLEQAQRSASQLYADWGHRQQPIWLPVVLEGLESIKFSHESIDYHDGESFMKLYAREGDRVVGFVDYSIYQGEIHVKMIEVVPDKRRGGIATTMAQNLQAQYPEMEIDWGMMTPEGTGFMNSLDRTFEPEQGYDELKRAYDAATEEYKALQAEFDAWIEAKKGLLNKDMLLKGERMNELQDLIWGLEDRLRDMKPGKWRVVTESDMTPEEMSKFVQQALTLGGDWRSDVKELAVGLVTDWTLHLEDPSGKLVSSTVFLRDYGLDDGANGPRHTWLKVHLVTPLAEDDPSRALGDQWAMFDFDTDLHIRPSGDEFESMKTVVKDTLVSYLKPKMLSKRRFDANDHRQRLRDLFTRITKSFGVNRWVWRG